MITEWLDAFREHLNDVDYYDLNPPATTEAVAAVEQALTAQDRVEGFRFPPSYKEFLLRFNGGNLNDNWEDSEDEDSEVEESGGWIDVRFFNVSEAERSGMSLMEYNAADSVLMDHEIETYFNFEPLAIFAADTGSNFWGFDPRQAQPDGEVPVRFCDHESGEVYEQAVNFRAFVEGLTDRMIFVRSYGAKLPDVTE